MPRFSGTPCTATNCNDDDGGDHFSFEKYSSLLRFHFLAILLFSRCLSLILPEEPEFYAFEKPFNPLTIPQDNFITRGIFRNRTPSKRSEVPKSLTRNEFSIKDEELGKLGKLRKTGRAEHKTLFQNKIVPDGIILLIKKIAIMLIISVLWRHQSVTSSSAAICGRNNFSTSLKTFKHFRWESFWKIQSFVD